MPRPPLMIPTTPVAGRSKPVIPTSLVARRASPTPLDRESRVRNGFAGGSRIIVIPSGPATRRGEAMPRPPLMIPTPAFARA